MSAQDISVIVAASENDVIGFENQLPWHLSADLKRFRTLTTGHHIIMGRKTFDSIGRLLPDRTTVIVTRNPDFYFDGASIANSLEGGLKLVGQDPKPFIVGGAEIYRQSLPLANSIYLTRVHTEVLGDTYLPAIDWDQWHCVSCDRFQADRKNDFDYSFLVYRRRGENGEQ